VGEKKKENKKDLVTGRRLLSNILASHQLTVEALGIILD
jgi:hypothetical protein